MFLKHFPAGVIPCGNIHGKAILPVCLMLLACLIVSGIPAHAAEKTYTNSIGMKFVLIPAGSITREWHTLPVFTKRMEHA